MIKVFDSVIDAAGQEEIAGILLGWQFPWYHYANTNYGDKATRPDDVPQFTHGFIRENQKNSPLVQIPLVILEKMQIPASNILRAKANLLMREPAPFTHPAHIDDSKPHVGMIYYVNDSDGDTHFYDKGAVIKTVSPKAGRAVMFDGATYHASASPTQNRYRIVINFNLAMGDWFGDYDGPKG
ncbi:2OG-Fe(II) oxygenase [Fretibacter rubidus]|uniref:2OG-Fe(II) oxygenase n=1 Tax=Fretibacter rubidus TaxID=570162 RepID=UPI00352B8B4C